MSLSTGSRDICLRSSLTLSPSIIMNGDVCPDVRGAEEEDEGKEKAKVRDDEDRGK